jgi:hypothetical protein
MVVNQADTSSLRSKLVSSGFYARWHERFGPQVWGLLEKSSGKLT